MSRALIALVFACLLASQVSADCKGELSKLLPTAIKLFNDASNDNTAQFEADLTAAIPAIEAAGQACTGFTPTTQCNTDITNLQPSFDKIIDDIAADNVSQLEKDIAATADSFNSAVTDCTGFVVTSQCSTDLLSLIGPGAAVVDDIRDNHLSNLEADLDSFLPYGRSAIEDCTGNTIDDTCQNDINGIVPSLVAVVNDLEAANYAQLVSDLTAAVPQLETTVQDCLGHPVTQTCEADLIGLIPAGISIFNDINSKNWDQLQKDLSAATPQIDAAYQACIGGTTLKNLEDDCPYRLSQLVPTMIEMYEDLINNDNVDLINLAKDQKSTMQDTVEDCNDFLQKMLNKE